MWTGADAPAWLQAGAALIERRRGDCARGYTSPLCISGKLHMLDPVITVTCELVIMTGEYRRISILEWWRT